jgi:hypothetical protein
VFILYSGTFSGPQFWGTGHEDLELSYSSALNRRSQVINHTPLAGVYVWQIYISSPCAQLLIAIFSRGWAWCPSKFNFREWR